MKKTTSSFYEIDYRYLRQYETKTTKNALILKLQDKINVICKKTKLDFFCITSYIIIHGNEKADMEAKPLLKK